MKKTPLYHLHRELGARLVPFAGYDMPVQYTDGILKEHQHTREQAGLFDVSHMGQIEISGRHAAAELEKLLPLDLEALSLSRQAYTLLPNGQGGVIDDLIVTRRNRDNFVLVANAGCKDKVIAWLSQQLETSPIHVLNSHALLALQGPAACRVLCELFPPEVASLDFMQGMLAKFGRVECFISRSGYTGEDGFEISLPSVHAEALARQLLALTGVKPIGLGARDSLRLEAGLCLYGHELAEDISPIEAGLGWAISKSRREGGAKSGGFTGSDIILQQLETGTAEQRIGLVVQGKVPVREGATLFDDSNREVGTVTSGTFSPTLGVPIAMAYVDARAAVTGSLLTTMVRGNSIPLVVTRLPFIKPRYVRHSGSGKT